MKLHVESIGEGPDIVLLHGWGLHAEVWNDTAQQLATRFRVTLIDLPGHGRSTSMAAPAHPCAAEDYSLSRVAASIAEVAPPHAIWLGWSLGGMVATHIAATLPSRVTALILVASTPQFVRDDDWPHAMDGSVLESFAQALQENHAQTVQRFLALVASGILPLATLVHPCTSQTRGAAQRQDTLRRLRNAVMQYPPQPEALRGGLAILRDARLRPYLRQITCSVQIILGERDTLVPSEVGVALQAEMADACLKIIAAAGHAPFLSHPVEFMNCINGFLGQI